MRIVLFSFLIMFSVSTSAFCSRIVTNNGVTLFQVVWRKQASAFYPQSLYFFQFLIYRKKMVLCATKTYFLPSNRHRRPRSLMKEEQGNRERIW